MKRRAMIAACLLCLLAVTMGYAATTGEQLQREGGNNTPVQHPAWNGTKTALLTAASTIIDCTKDLFYSVYSSAACYERLLPSATANKALYPKVPIPANAWQPPSIVNPATPYVNYSGCSGAIKRH
jgi:hypothetical protein